MISMLSCSSLFVWGLLSFSSNWISCIAISLIELNSECISYMFLHDMWYSSLSAFTSSYERLLSSAGGDLSKLWALLSWLIDGWLVLLIEVPSTMWALMPAYVFERICCYSCIILSCFREGTWGLALGCTDECRGWLFYKCKGDASLREGDLLLVRCTARLPIGDCVSIATLFFVNTWLLACLNALNISSLLILSRAFSMAWSFHLPFDFVS